jgi:hypothetical protein
MVKSIENENFIEDKFKKIKNGYNFHSFLFKNFGKFSFEKNRIL